MVEPGDGTVAAEWPELATSDGGHLVERSVNVVDLCLVR
jgi:hypothetical protein